MAGALAWSNADSSNTVTAVVFTVYFGMAAVFVAVGQPDATCAGQQIGSRRPMRMGLPRSLY
jgi:hypothetical protein